MKRSLYHSNKNQMSARKGGWRYKGNKSDQITQELQNVFESTAAEWWWNRIWMLYSLLSSKVNGFWDDWFNPEDSCICFHLASCHPFPNILHIVQVHSLHESFVVPTPEILNSWIPLYTTAVYHCALRSFSEARRCFVKIVPSLQIACRDKIFP